MKFKNKIVLYLTFVLFIAAFSAGIFYYWIVKPSQIVLDAGEKIANGVADAFNFTPQVTFNNNVIFEEHAAIMEVALLSQRLAHDFEYTNTWMGSTKTLHLRGVYLAKYGFDLKNQTFLINIEEDSSGWGDSINLTIIIPEPRLLSLETENYRILQDEEGWWNKFDKSERGNAVNRMRKEAKKEAMSIDYQSRVKKSIETQVNMMLNDLHLPVNIRLISFIWQDSLLNQKNEF